MVRKLELFLHKKIASEEWLAFAKPSKILNESDVFDFDGNKIISQAGIRRGRLE